jgi:hypothetical protein
MRIRSLAGVSRSAQSVKSEIGQVLYLCQVIVYFFDVLILVTILAVVKRATTGGALV